MFHSPNRHTGQKLWLSFVITFAAIAAVFISAPTAFAYDQEEIAFLNLINNYRQSIGLRTLEVNAKLSLASERHSNDMGVRGYFAHNTPEGITPWDRIRAAGYGYNTSLGENLAAGYSTAQAAFTGWKNSPGHDANMRNASYCAVGIARVNVPGSIYGYYWTTDFGGVCEGDPQPTPETRDVTPPTVSVPGPSGSTLVSGLVVLKANASDNVGVARVELYVDGRLVANDTAAPYSYVWDTRGLSGSHRLEAVAFDGAGNSARGSTDITADNFAPSKRYLFTWYDQSSSDWKDWVLMANPSTNSTTARASAQVGSITYADRRMAPGAQAETPQFPGILGGPVTVASTQSLITSQRVVYKKSFNEIPGLAQEDLETTYYFSWYDSTTGGGMVGDWILIGNRGSVEATVQVYIGGALKGTYGVPAGGQITPSYPNTTDGPVKVISTNNQPLIVSQRVLYRDSFNEVLGIPESKLASDYSFTWYDAKPENSMRGNWIMVANQDIGIASVDVYIGGNKMGSYSIREGDHTALQYPGVMDGPVRVISTNGKRLIVSQRIIFKESFEEFQGLGAGDYGTDLWFTWYDSIYGNGMNGNWILVANQGRSTANVDVYIGGTLRRQLTIAEGDNVPLSFSGTMAGPVRIVSTNRVPLLATQRVIYLNSFNEIGGMQLQ